MNRRSVQFAKLVLPVMIVLVSGLSQAQHTLIDPHISNPEDDSLIARIQRIPADEFTRGRYFTTAGDSIQYRLLMPQEANAKSKTYPLVIVFHGSGGIGTDNVSQLGLFSRMWALPALREKYPAYIVVPQFSTRSSNYAVDSIYQVRASAPGPQLFVLIEFIEDLITRYQVNPEKIYVMGYSMGASTVLNCLGMRPDLFRAGVSFAGVPQFTHLEILKKKPIWFIHGNADTTNPIVPARLLFDSLSKNNNVRFSELQNADHHMLPPVELMVEQIPAWLMQQ